MEQTPSSPLLLLQSGVWEDPSCLPLLISPASLLCLQDQCSWWGWGGWKWGPWRAGDWPGSSAGSPGLSEQGKLPLLLSRSSWMAPPTCHSRSPGLPPMPPRPTRPGRGFGGGKQLGSSVGSPARVGQVIALCSSPALPRESLPPASPDLPGLRGADLV